MNSLKNLSLKAALLVFAGTAFMACSRDANDPGTEYAPDMYYPVAPEPLKQVELNKFNYREGGTNLRYPVAGTVARGKMAYYTHFKKDSLEAAAAFLKNPLVFNEKNLADG